MFLNLQTRLVSRARDLQLGFLNMQTRLVSSSRDLQLIFRLVQETASALARLSDEIGSAVFPTPAKIEL
jgi:hypothetical protein